ncbi:nuclease-related domain-containing protein [Bacillus sp. 165]|uniref:nuclease-related domain-containing protein n=1 Tax=Bacillus sp. 165 TaxID=1529117 RepID=UPI001ADAEB76|nr:nuclease-related domain-containing protein [Bacillus sp. 165]MBO9130041.1 NERD domain-containing protein [Bacillus sp. 165]
MIKKERKKPLKIRKLEALMRRLPPFHPKRPIIEEELAKSMAGYRGEQSLDYHLDFLPPKRYFIFHDLRLLNPPHFFQLDTLILSPCFLLIIEVKNITGTLYFDSTFHQLTRTMNGKEEGFPSPLLQVKRQLSQLNEWLQTNKFPAVPIETLVVISSPSTIIKASHHLPTVIHRDSLVSKIESFEKKHKEQKLSEQELRRLSARLLKRHTPISSNILQRFRIDEIELLKGVHCPECRLIPMQRKGHSWLCSSCNYSSKDAHIETLQDYALLISPTITNQQLRGFLQLPSRHIATKILMSMGLKHVGITKGRVYQLFID